MPRRIDPWENGNPYERFMGRWSRPVAQEFLKWLPIPANQRWLDVGCGTGVLSSLILDQMSPTEILAVDPSEAFVTYARQSLPASRLQFKVGDAMDLPVEPDYFDVVVSGLALNFIPNPAQALAEMRRAIRPNGVVAVYVWDYAGQMQMLRYFWDAAVALNPAAKALDEGERFPLCQPHMLEKLFYEAGLQNVEVQAIDASSVFENFEDYWSPFLGEVGPAPGYVKSLGSDQRLALEDRLRATLPIDQDGIISLVARAWAGKSTV